MFLLLPNIDKVASQALKTLKKGRALADITPQFDASPSRTLPIIHAS